MAGWRDDASPQAQQELDQLLNIAIGFAQHELESRGEFFPYAAAVTGAGEPEFLAVQSPQGGERPEAEDLIAECVSALSDMRDRVRAAAVVTDVQTADGDAIRVDLEHGEGHAVTVLLPYARRDEQQTVEYGVIRAQASRPQIWTSM